MARGLAVTSALGLAMLVATFASCATADTSSPPPVPEDASVLPEASPPELKDDAGPDAGCDTDASDCTTQVVPCDQVAWCAVETKVSVFHALAAVWGSSASDVWAVGSGGTIIHYDGKTWTPTPSGVHEHVLRGLGQRPERCLRRQQHRGDPARQRHSARRRYDLDALPDPLSIVLHPLHARGLGQRPERRSRRRPPVRRRSHATGFAGGDQLLKRTLADGGTTWRPLPGAHTVTSIWGSSANDVWMTAENTRLARSTARGVPMPACSTAACSTTPSRGRTSRARGPSTARREASSCRTSRSSRCGAAPRPTYGRSAVSGPSATSRLRTNAGRRWPRPRR